MPIFSPTEPLSLKKQGPNPTKRIVVLVTNLNYPKIMPQLWKAKKKSSKKQEEEPRRRKKRKGQKSVIILTTILATCNGKD